MPSERIEGWQAIAEYFPCALSTFQRKHAKEMLKAGYAFRSHIDKPHTSKKTPMIWSFEPLIFAYISQKQAKDGKV